MSAAVFRRAAGSASEAAWTASDSVSVKGAAAPRLLVVRTCATMPPRLEARHQSETQFALALDEIAVLVGLATKPRRPGALRVAGGGDGRNGAEKRTLSDTA